MKYILTFLIFLLSINAYGNETAGKVNAPGIDIINVLKVNSGDQIFAGTWGSGVYLSNDTGNTWQPRNNQLGNLHINDIAINSEDEIYAATNGGGIYFSDNAGNQWSQLSLDSNLFVTSIYINPYDDNVIYAGTYGSGLFISTNKGSTWEPRNSSIIRDGVLESISSLHITAIAVTKDTNLLIGTYGAGIYRSTDNGLNWRAANSGTGGTKYINQISVINKNLILAATNDKGLVESANDGLQWGEFAPQADSLFDDAITCFTYTDTPIIGTREAGIWTYNAQPYSNWLPSNLIHHYGTVDIVKLSDQTLIAYNKGEGILRSTNNGLNWVDHALGNAEDSSMVVTSENYLLFNSNDGKLFRSSDLGNAWEELTSYPGGVAKRIKYKNGILAIVLNETLYLSTNEGETWQSPSTSVDSDDFLYDVAIGEDVIYYAELNAAPAGEGFETNQEIHKSTDMGNTWEKTYDAGTNGDIVYFMDIAPNGDIYVYQTDSGANYLILKSTDGGYSYEEQGYEENVRVTKMEYVDNTLFLATKNGLFISKDQGTSFSKVEIPMLDRPYFFIEHDGEVTSFAAHNRNEFYVGFPENWGVYKTTNGGTEWDSLNPGYNTFHIGSMTVNNDGDFYYSSGNIYRYLNTKNMGVPQLQQPANGSYNISLQPNLEWDEADKAELYQVELSTNNKFPFAQERVILEENQREVFYNLDYNTEYYWRVRGKTDGVYSKWSAVSSFSTLLAPPELISPEDSSESISLAPEFEWEEVEGGSYYEIQVSSTAEFDDIVIHQDSVSETEYLSLIEERLEPLSWYYWRVRAKNENNTGEWSVVWIFRTGIGSPTLRFPENNSVNHPNNIEFVWYKNAETINYRIQVSRMEDMSLIILDTETQNDTLQAFTDLNYNVDYYWRVAGIDSNGVQGPWSEIWKFSTGLEPPAHISPENNSGNMPSDVTLEWEGTEGYTYSLQVAYNTDFATPVYNETNLSENTFELTDLQSNRTFYWRVRSFNDEGTESAWSNPWNFSTGLARVELLEPANGSTDREYKSQIFKWQGVNGAETYSLQISENATFTNIFYDEEDISLTSKDVYDFKAEQTYHWRVKASNESGSSDWSEVWSFTTKKVTMVTMDGEETGIRVYPNPAEDEVSIEMPQELIGSYNIELINSTGRTVMTDNLNGRYKNLKLKELNNSNYYIIISSDDKRFVIKINKVK